MAYTITHHTRLGRVAVGRDHGPGEAIRRAYDG
jgi:hypothetical protein